MLHEVLLALSGHPSPLFDHGSERFPHVTAAETALLESVGHLASLHRALRSHLTRISSSHPSIICRAVANAIRTQHLAQFQKAILDVEDRVLKKDASVVGAYNIVPLANVVGSFDEWRRRLEWYWDLASYIFPPDKIKKSSPKLLSAIQGCTGADLINRFTKDARTGYPDIEQAATELLKTAEKSWLKQLMLWLLNGQRTNENCPDLFIVTSGSSSGSYSVNSAAQPTFVADDAASSIIFIGKAMAHLSSSARGGTSLINNRPEIGSSHAKCNSVNLLGPLSTLDLPVSSSQFSKAISQVRTSLCQRLVTEILPTSQIMRTLSLIREFFLVGRGDFVDTLVGEADSHMRSRHMRTKSSNLSSGTSLAGVIMKESESQAVLSRVWLALAPLVEKGSVGEADLDWARDYLKLEILAPDGQSEAGVDTTNDEDDLEPLSKRITYIFNDILLSTPTTLSILIKSPLDLFLSSSDLRIYGSLNAYLMSFRRAHLHLTGLWKITGLRKNHPAPLGPPQSNSEWGQRTLKEGRQKHSQRAVTMRSVWSSSSAVVSVLSEVGEYFSREVIGKSWETFRRWAEQHHSVPSDLSRPPSSYTNAVGHPLHPPTDFGKLLRSEPAVEDVRLPRDPEVLSRGHRQYLKALTKSLLLDHPTFPSVLKAMLAHVDLLVGLVTRLEVIRKNIDLQDEGVLDDATKNYAKDEKDVTDQMNTVAQSLGQDIKKLVETLKEINNARWLTTTLPQDRKQSEFEPWRASGIDRLLLRLDSSMFGDDSGD